MFTDYGSFISFNVSPLITGQCIMCWLLFQSLQTCSAHDHNNLTEGFFTMAGFLHFLCLYAFVCEIPYTSMTFSPLLILDSQLP